MTEERIIDFVRAHIRSLWTLELLLLLTRDRQRGWRVGELVGELRSSAAAVNVAMRDLVQAGMAKQEADGICRFAAVSSEIGQMGTAIAALYAEKPSLLVRTIVTAGDAKLKMFADAFKIRGG